MPLINRLSPQESPSSAVERGSSRLNGKFGLRLAAACILLLTSIPRCLADPNDEFVQGLLDRGLVQVAENEAIRRLTDPFVKPVERVQWSLRLASAYMRHAAAVSGEDRQTLARRAEQTLVELLAVSPPLPRQEQIRAQRALLQAEHAELLTWEWLYGNGGEQRREAALAALRLATESLAAAQAQLAADVRIAARRTPTQLADGELSAAELRHLEKDVEHRLASVRVSFAEIAPEGDERSQQMGKADQQLQELANGWTGDVRTWEARLLRARLARIRGEYGISAGQIRAAQNEQLARWLSDRFTAELVRGQIAEGRLDVALDTLLQQSRQPGGLSDELHFLQVDALLHARRLAEQKSDQATADALSSQAEAIALALPGGWGSVARSRLDRELEASRYGPAVARLVQEARSAYQAGDLDQAITRFQQAADLAVQEGQTTAADELDYTRGSILINSERYDAAVAVLDRLIARAPQGSHTPDANLLRAYGTGKMYSATPTAELQARYIALLEQHRQQYPGTPSATEATWMQAAFEDARQQWTQALSLYLELSSHPERGAAAQLRVAVLYEQILGRLRELGQPVDAWEDSAVEHLAAFVHRYPTSPQQLSLTQAELTVRLVRIVLAHREHVFREAARLLDPVLQAGEYQRREAQRTDAPVPPEWTQLTRTASQLLIISLAGQGQTDAARERFNQLALTEPKLLLGLLQGLSLLSVDIPEEHRQALAHLQLETAQQLRLQQPDLSDDERRLLDEAVADAYLAAGNDLNAAAFFDKLLEQSPRDRTRLRTASELHQRIGSIANFERAKSYWQRLERLETKGSVEWLEARLHIAECAVRLGNGEEARKLINLTRLIYPELGGPELRQRYAAVEAEAHP